MTKKYRDINHEYYDAYYQFPERGKWMEKVWSEAFGEQYPGGLGHYGYLTKHDLEVFASRLQLPEGSSVLDIGCGKGGPGLTLAQDLKLKLTGIDLIPAAIEQANTFKEKFDLAYPAHFEVGEFYDIPLPDQSMDAVISFDSIWVVQDKLEALRKVKRVMKPGAKFIFTHWDLTNVEPVPIFEQSGLTFIHREDTPNWKEYQQKVYAGIEQHQEEIYEEMGEASQMLFYEATASPPYLDLSVRRIYHFELR